MTPEAASPAAAKTCSGSTSMQASQSSCAEPAASAAATLSIAHEDNAVSEPLPCASCTGA